MQLDIGLLGATLVAQRAIVGPSARHTDTAVRAVAASDHARAAEFAARVGISTVYPTYLALLEDPAINVVYISLHNSAHYEWAERAAQAGKHVVVEKPLCLSARECTQITSAARRTGVRFLEAVASAGHQWRTALVALADGGRYGELRSVRTTIQFAVPRSDGYRCRRDLGGGIFFDAASYWLEAVQSIWDLTCATGRGSSDFAGPGGVDMSFRAQLEWPDGRESSLNCSFSSEHRSEHEFVFDRAVARLRHFLLPMAGRAPLNMVLRGPDVARTVTRFAPVSYYEHQFERIRELLTSDASERSSEAACAERIKLMAAIYGDARMRLGKEPG